MSLPRNREGEAFEPCECTCDLIPLASLRPAPEGTPGLIDRLFGDAAAQPVSAHPDAEPCWIISESERNQLIASLRPAEGPETPESAINKPMDMPHWKCRQCGCLWRDNLDGSVSLFDADQTSCQNCEMLLRRSSA